MQDKWVEKNLFSSLEHCLLYIIRSKASFDQLIHVGKGLLRFESLGSRLLEIFLGPRTINRAYSPRTIIKALGLRGTFFLR